MTKRCAQVKSLTGELLPPQPTQKNFRKSKISLKKLALKFSENALCALPPIHSHDQHNQQTLSQ